MVTDSDLHNIFFDWKKKMKFLHTLKDQKLRLSNSDSQTLSAFISRTTKITQKFKI